MDTTIFADLPDGESPRRRNRSFATCSKLQEYRRKAVPVKNLTQAQKQAELYDMSEMLRQDDLNFREAEYIRNRIATLRSGSDPVGAHKRRLNRDPVIRATRKILRVIDADRQHTGGSSELRTKRG